MSSNKSGSQGQVISLPKGGGAIKGIGEKFQPNLFSGTGNFSVPIFASPGRSGFVPQLTLQYSTGNGNSPFGMGWQLSIPRITRKTEKGLPIYTDKDVFVMSGAEDLVPCLKKINDPTNGEEKWILKDPIPLGDYKITRYRPRTEGLFTIESLIKFLGKSDWPLFPITTILNYRATWVKWKSLSFNFANFHNKLLLSQWLARKDPFSGYRAGFEIRTTRLCKRVFIQ